MLIIIAVVAVMIFGGKVYVNRNPFPTAVTDSIAYKYEVVDTLTFNLGSNATPYFRSIDFFKIKEKRIFSFYNEYTQQIYLYNYDTPGKPFNKITLQDDVLGSLSKITGYTIHNLDSIFVYGYSSDTIALVNSKGKLLDIFKWKKMLTEKVSQPPKPTTWSFSPMVYQRGKIIIDGWVISEGKPFDKHNRPITVIVDLKKDKAWFDGYYPDVYRKGNWGGIHYRKVYSTYNPENKLWVYSFPASHYVYSTHHRQGEKLMKHYAGSRQIAYIKSMDDSFGTFGTMARRHKYYALHNSYSAIFYDKWKKRYYRFGGKKIEKYEGELYKQKVLVLLDDSLKYISEIDLSTLTKGMIYIYGVFNTKEGLNLQILNGNEDQIFILILKCQPV